MAREKLTGNYRAIQCKFFSPDSTLQKGDIDSFFTASGKTFPTTDGHHSFSSRIVVSTTDKWSKHADEALANQTIPVIRLRVQDLADSPIDWSTFNLHRSYGLSLLPKKQARPHQIEAIEKVLAQFSINDRGKLIMACGTGKTFTALKVAEAMTGETGIVLFLVPSISLLSQTLREWTAEIGKTFHAFAVCSDTKVGRHNEDMSVHDLALPATTNSKRLADAVKLLHGRRQMTIIFSTYQSISVVAEAQKLGLPEIDLTVCDEAHRTTGVTLSGDDESQFVLIHREDFIKSKKRLYMTATPRIFADSTKSKAQEHDATLCSMDDTSLYGPVFHRLGFGEAVGKGLLADYKVLVLAVDEKHVSKALQNSLADANKEINLDDAVKIVGCWNGLSKRLIGDEAKNEDPAPMRRAVAFARSIKDSKHLAEMFQSVVDEYIQKHGEEKENLSCEVHHVDGTFNVLKRNNELDWLREDMGENVCHILSNARCLTEGIDVPSLDAVLFLNPRDSVVDVVQSVGRVMRLVKGKKYGYVILPISVPAGMPPEEALKDNKRYRVVWQVLQALRAHDDRFNATVNQIELNKKRPDQIQVIGVGGDDLEGEEGADGKDKKGEQIVINFPEIEAWKDAIYAKMVLKCGDRRYWEDWAQDVARIAERHTARITALIESSGDAKEAFERFLSGLHDNINPSISEGEAIEMISQHLITRPVFDALFENYSFTQKNPVSITMQELLKVLEAQTLEKEVEALKGFYQSVRQRVQGIDNAEGRQRIVIELYDKFFKLAFPKIAERLGIVYTPVEVVDFIIQSVEDVLRKHFGAGLTDNNVHILDPFTGTGTFIVRMLKSGLIRPKDLERKYREELHANEIVLLAYYIAAINIEETYHGIKDGDYQPFDGIVLTDTFQMSEEGNQKGFGETMFPENNKRVKRQKTKDIRVIVGNPPYKQRQESANDNNQNLKYPKLDERIRITYAEHSSAANKKDLYDSYVRAIRWASDRIRDQGVIGFVTNGSFIEGTAADGIRKVLPEDFSTIYCFNLRGNQRTSGELSRQEGGKIFGSGSRAPIAITLLIKDPKHQGRSELFYYDIGDYISRDEKLKAIRDFGSITSLPLKALTPNEDGDWINQRNPEFDTFMLLGDKSGNKDVIFSIYSLGVATHRDAWVYNYDRRAVTSNMTRMIDYYNSEVKRFQLACKSKPKDQWPDVGSFVDADPKKISWGDLKSDLLKAHQYNFDTIDLVTSMYRPFSKQWMYFNRHFNERVYKMPFIFPTQRHRNIVISVTGIGASKSFSAIVASVIPDLQLQSNAQCFPLYWYEKVEDGMKGETGRIFDASADKPDVDGYIRHDAITDFALENFRKHYCDKGISKEDIFYYVYGIFHSPHYFEKYGDSLKKMMPRIPYTRDFEVFSRAGRKMANLQLNYETTIPWQLNEESKDLALDPTVHYRVEKMAFAKTGTSVDKSTIIYNSRIRLSGIPPETYQYVVNGKSAIEWVMERYAVTVDKDSGIKNDPNLWSDDARYIIDMVKRVVRVSVETVRIVKALPTL